MRNRRVSAAAIHNADGDGETHQARSLALRRFAQGRLRVLAATEMLAIGVDVKGASHIVNAEVPTTPSSYLHRAGRVGRVGGSAGTVISLPKTQDELRRLHDFASELGFTLETHSTWQQAAVEERWCS